MSNGIIRVFVNTHMGLMHDGLRELLKSHRVAEPQEGEHVVFVNSARDRVKMLSKGNIIHYLRLRPGEKLRMETVQFFPQCFVKGGKIDYDKALRRSFAEFLVTSKKKSRDKTEL